MTASLPRAGTRERAAVTNIHHPARWETREEYSLVILLHFCSSSAADYLFSGEMLTFSSPGSTLLDPDSSIPEQEELL